MHKHTLAIHRYIDDGRSFSSTAKQVLVNHSLDPARTFSRGYRVFAYPCHHSKHKLCLCLCFVFVQYHVISYMWLVTLSVMCVVGESTQLWYILKYYAASHCVIPLVNFVYYLDILEQQQGEPWSCAVWLIWISLHGVAFTASPCST